ncbi:MAG TPA: hypothetical protein VHN37_10535 [Actinomycetota bacterium]|nr:hypothetical protein [Actinomycetota bacterium]
MKRLCAVLALACVALAGLPGTALADHDDGIYEIPTRDFWDKTKLTVLVVPPEHGQLYNAYGPLAGGNPEEVTPFENSYIRAMEDSIEEWRNGVRKFGSALLRKKLKFPTYVLGRDDVPPEVLQNPDILVVTDENKGPVLGFAYYSKPCIVNNSRMFTRSFTYADMFNVMGQEFGHCLGLGHVGSQGGVEPTSSQKHPEHDVMNGFYADPIGGEGVHLHCVSTLDVAALDWTFKKASGSDKNKTIYMLVDDYETTCGGDGRVSPQDRSERFVF